MEDYDIILEPGRRSKNYWFDIWRYRELFYMLAWRDLKVRYKQTFLGFAWSVIRPLLTMVIFTVIFGKLANFPSEGAAPYAIMVYAAMLPWNFFANSLSESSASLVGNAKLITKVYFPRIIVPASAIMVSLADFLISFCILLGMMVYFQFYPSIQVLLLPVFLAVAFLASFGVGVLLTALNVKYRDFRYVIPFIVQVGLYISPVGFSSSIIPEEYRLMYYLNPMAGVIDGFRWALLGEPTTFYWPGFLVSFGLIVLIAIAGVRYFRRMEKTFADYI